MSWKQYDPLPESEAPPRRSAHTACIVDCRYLYVFGGWVYSNGMFFALYVYSGAPYTLYAIFYSWDGSVEVGDVTRLDLGASAPARNSSNSTHTCWSPPHCRIKALGARRNDWRPACTAALPQLHRHRWVWPTTIVERS